MKSLKFLSITFFTILAITLVILFNFYRSNVSTDPIESSIAKTSTTFLETTVSESLATTTFLNETVLNQSSYPPATLPERLADLAIYEAIDDYYRTNYSQEEKEANLTQVDSQTLVNLETTLQSSETLSSLSIEIDQVTLTLDGQLCYIPRIIIPMPFDRANELVPDHDIDILTESFTALGNRLIMLTYYYPETQQLTLYHLTNWTTPLFSYSD